MRSLSSKNWDVNYLLYEESIFTKYAWVKALNNKKGKTVLTGFIEIVKSF